MITKQKRDAKFMIYLGLYLFVIAYITVQGATIGKLGPPPDPPPEVKFPTYDPSRETVTRKPGGDSTIMIVPNAVNPDDYAKLKGDNEKLKNEISNLKKNYSKSDNSQTPNSNNAPSTRDKDNR